MFAENKLFAAGGRAGVPPVEDFTVAEGKTIVAGSGLFWLEVVKMLFALGVPEEAV